MKSFQHATLAAIVLLTQPVLNAQDTILGLDTNNNIVAVVSPELPVDSPPAPISSMVTGVTGIGGDSLVAI